MTTLDDFDYCNSGGFVIECQNGDMLGVSKEQAEQVSKKCEFFQNCFDHGMVESQRRIVQKHDWTLAIARHMIEALTKGRTTLPSLELYKELMEAGDFLCLDLRLCSFVNYTDPLYSQSNRFLELVSDPTKYCFRLKAKISSDIWLRLLVDSVLLNRENTNYVVQVYDNNVSRSTTTARQNLDARFTEYRVHADRNIQAMMHIHRMLTIHTGLTWPKCLGEQFSIYYETTHCIPQEHHELIDRLAGGEAYIRTCADAGDFQSEGYTIQSSFDVLKRAIAPLADKEDDGTNTLECSLRIDNPTPDTLGRFINACQKAETYPGTIGLDAFANRYFCRKTLKDIFCMLEYLADYSTTAKVEGDYTLHVLSSEDEAF